LTNDQSASSKLSADAVTNDYLLMTTNQQYHRAINKAREIFLKKTKDYGTSWRVLRPIAVVDQIFIKAKRIRTIQENKSQKVADDIPSEFMGILNYAVIGLIQLELHSEEVEEIPVDRVEQLYDKMISRASELMKAKNHDYGEAWREMSQESFVDLILSKVLRLRQIIANEGKTLISEGIDANYYDIINYAVFALILIGENESGKKN
jgi:hypothetical protein